MTQDSHLIYQEQTPIQKVVLPLQSAVNCDIFMKRDDLIHPVVSGNKWRKLKYNVEQAKLKRKQGILTFGGAFSNHLVATAAACHQAGLQSIGIVRGEEADLNNPTLKACRDFGMEVKPISRGEYGLKNDEEYLGNLKLNCSTYYIVPEGGSNYYGVMGAAEVIGKPERNFEIVAGAVGTGTSLAGLLLGTQEHQQVLGFTAVKNGGYLKEEVENLLMRSLMDEETVSDLMEKLTLVTDYHFGGFAKADETLAQFIREFKKTNNIQLDAIYNGKMMYGLNDMIQTENWKGKKILAIHCGGLQGNASIEKRFGLQLS